METPKRRALREGAAPYLDACAFHPYGIDKPEGGMGTMEWHQGKNLSQTREQTGWSRVEEVIEGVRKPYAQHGNTNIAVWLNEWGLNLTGLDYSYNPKVGEYAYAKYISRFYIYNGWLGHPAALWALHTENLSQDWSMIDPKTFELRPLSYAMQNACSVVSDVEPIPAPAHDFSGAAPDLKVIAYRRDNSNERLVLLWSALLNTEKVLAYPGRFGFTWPSRPKKVLLTDLYWGLAQPAQWSYANGRVSDIAADPLWEEFRATALSYGLKACWSKPVNSTTGAVLGTFALYYGEVRSPGKLDLLLIERATHIAQIAIERDRTQDSLRACADRVCPAQYASSTRPLPRRGQRAGLPRPDECTK